MADTDTLSQLETAQRRYIRALIGFGLLIAVLNLAALTLLLLSTVRADEDRATIKAQSALLLECTTPPEERIPPVKITDPKNDCYARGLQQQGQAVSNITVSSVVAAACGAANPGDVPKTKACFEREIKRLRAEL